MMMMITNNVNEMMKLSTRDHDKVTPSAISDSGSLPKRFPFRLNDMLNDAERHGNDHIVSWLPDGKMFKVHKHKEFANRIMPLYCRHTRYKSFLRQLSMYKFQRINEGPMRGCYHHPNFARDRFDLIEKINRNDRDNADDTVASPAQKSMPAKPKKTAASAAKKQKQKSSSKKQNNKTPPHNDISNRMGETASYSDHTASEDEEFELIDFSADEKLTLETPARSADKPHMMVAPLSPTHRPQGVFRTMRQMSSLGGLFDVRDETKTTDILMKSTSAPLRLLSSTSTSTQREYIAAANPMPFMPSVPDDILDEIISTFGRMERR